MMPADDTMPGRIMTVAEVAVYLKVHRITVYRMARNRKIPAFKIGDDWRFDRDAIDKWMNDRHVKLRKN
jgi:excisionase family DNA binding protein